jgi:hypothetical protein
MDLNWSYSFGIQQDKKGSEVLRQCITVVLLLPYLFTVRLNSQTSWSNVDVTSEESFIKAQEWVKELKTNVYEDIILVVVGNQVDRPKRVVPLEDAVRYAESIGGLCFDTSAKTNAGLGKFTPFD